MAEPARAFVCGHPIAHSRSPLIHRHWLAAYSIAGSYEAIDVEPSRFDAFLRELPASGVAGGNVTIPHKEAAYRAVSRRDETAEATGAVNTLWIEEGLLHGGNTDVLGFAGNLDQFAPEWRRSGPAVVIGAGGAARAVVLALIMAGCVEIRIANRTVERSRALKDRFGSRLSIVPPGGLGEAMADANLLVNTTSLGMHGELSADPSRLPDHAVVTDIVYVPVRTPLLDTAAERGLKTVDGLGMLLHQAAPGFARWFGARPEVTDELRRIVLADIGRRP